MIVLFHSFGLRVNTLTLKFGFEPIIQAEKCARFPPPQTLIKNKKKSKNMELTCDLDFFWVHLYYYPNIFYFFIKICNF